MGFTEPEDLFSRESVSPEPDEIDFHDFDGEAFVEHEGDAVDSDARHGTNKGESTDGDPLVDADHSGDDGMIHDVGMAADLSHVGDNDFVSEVAVVRDMDARHEEVVAADSRDAELFGRRAVNGATFAEGVSVADDGPGRFASIAEVLGVASDHAVGIEEVVVTDAGVSHHGDVIEKPASRSDECSRADDAVGSDLNAIIQDGMWIDNCGRIDVNGHVPLRG